MTWMQRDIGCSDSLSDESCIDEYWEYVKKIGNFFR